MKIFFACIFLFGLVFISFGQTTVNLNASRDNTIYSDNTANSNGAGDNFTTGSVFAPVRRALIMFDLSAIPSGSAITAASLTLTMNRTISGAVNLSLHQLTSPWGEGASDAGAGGDGNGAPSAVNDANWICSFANGAGGCITSWLSNGGDFVAGASATTSVSGIGSYIWGSAQLITDIQGWINDPPTNNGWMIIGDEITPRTAKRFSSRTSPNTAERPLLSITYTAPLPVDLLYFKATVSKYDAELKWATAQEINSDYFEVEHSADGLSFISIGKIKAAGNSSQTKQYTYRHFSPAIGQHFYRLRQIDVGGFTKISSIQSININSKNNNLAIMPNPATDYIRLSGFEITGKQSYSVLNIHGQVISTGKLTSSFIQLPESIHSGVYHFRVINSNGEVKTGSFIKL